MNLNPYLTPYTQNYFKNGSEDQIKGKTIKLLEGNTGNNLGNIRIGRFLRTQSTITKFDVIH